MTKRTDKPRRYFVFLIRLIYEYELYHDCTIEGFASMDCYRKLKKFYVNTRNARV